MASFFRIALFCVACVALPPMAHAADHTVQSSMALRALQAACVAVDGPEPVIAAMQDGSRNEAEVSEFELGLGLTGWRIDVDLADGGALEVSRLASGRQMHRVVVEYIRDGRRILQARAERGCDRIEGRMLRYGSDGRAETVLLLDQTLVPDGRELALDPPVPPGRDPEGTTVALLDTGVNYLQPAIAERLARDAGGAALGWDFWDDDPRPFDANPLLSPFHPARHGTTVARALLAEAGPVRLLPLRFPHGHPERLTQAVERAADNGTRVLLVGIGSRREEDWLAFAEAARAHPEMLIVVTAGRENEDIDDRAHYPAALALPSMIVVGAADGFGQPIRSNWGRRRVDVLAPAERLVLRNFDDVEEAVAGAEYAAARVAALAARLATGNPGLGAAELKAAILARAVLSDHGAPARSAYGVLPEDALRP